MKNESYKIERTPGLQPFVAFFQTSGSGQGCAYTLQAKSEEDAQRIVEEYAQDEWGEDAGEVMVYSPVQLRNLADRLDALQRGELGPEDEGWDIGVKGTPNLQPWELVPVPQNLLDRCEDIRIGGEPSESHLPAIRLHEGTWEYAGWLKKTKGQLAWKIGQGYLRKTDDWCATLLVVG